MKENFLWAMAIMVPSGILAWFLWTLGKSMFGMVQDQWLNRELDDLKNQSLPKPKTDIEKSDTQADYTSRM